MSREAAQSMTTIAANCVQTVAFIFAAIGAWVAYQSLEEGRKSTAMAQYQEYLVLAMTQPCLAHQNSECAPAIPALTPDVLEALDSEFLEYEFFVGNLLMACERIFLAFPKDEGWLSACGADFDRHSSYLLSEWFQSQAGDYSEDIQRLTSPSAFQMRQAVAINNLGSRND